MLTYQSSQGNGTVHAQDGMYSYDPNTALLHVQNFNEFEGRGPLAVHCALAVHRPDTRLVVRRVEVTIVYGKFSKGGLTLTIIVRRAKSGNGGLSLAVTGPLLYVTIV